MSLFKPILLIWLFSNMNMSISEETFKERFNFASWLLFLVILITDKFCISLEQKPIFENQDLNESYFIWL